MTSSPALPLLLLTRPRAQSERFAERAHSACPPHRLLVAPLTEISRLPFDRAALDGATLVFTSINGVAAVADGPDCLGRTAWCVGPATAAAARAAGFAVRESGGDAAHLLADLRSSRPIEPLVHVRGRHVACDLAATLAREELQIRAIVAYEARFQPWDAAVLPALSTAHRAVAPLFSPRAAETFSRRLGGVAPPGLRIVAISPACADRLAPGLRARALIANRPDGDAILDAVAENLAQDQSEP